MKKRLLGIFAHPDDESFAIGGTLAKYASQGVEIYLLCATRGEAGQWSEVSARRQRIGQVRERELLKAAKILGVKKVEFLGFIDGQINNEQIWRLEEIIVQKMREIKPQVAVCFDTSGTSGHLDHIATALAATRAFFKTREVKKLYYVVFPRSLTKRYRRPLPGFPDELITTKIDISKWWFQKVEAIKSHLTQKADWERYLKRRSYPKMEYFYLAQNRISRLKLPKDDLFSGV